MISFPIDEKLFEAIEPGKTAVSFIGDVDQLPSIGAGRIFDDLISSDIVPIFRLTKIFRQ